MANAGEAPFYGTVAQVKERPGWGSISAVQNDRIVIVNGDLFANEAHELQNKSQLPQKRSIQNSLILPNPFFVFIHDDG